MSCIETLSETLLTLLIHPRKSKNKYSHVSLYFSDTLMNFTNLSLINAKTEKETNYMH